MAEKIYPASKPSAGPPPTTTNPSFPASKAQPYNHTRPVYRPQPRRNRRSCCCSVILWLIFSLFLVIFLAAIAGGVFYVLYRPHRPTFTVSSLHVAKFNITPSNILTSEFNFTITARNPNKKIVFFYDPVSVSFDSNDVSVGEGTIAAFVMNKKNTTSLKTIVSMKSKTIDSNSRLKSDLKSKKNLQLKIQLDTKVKAKIGSLKTKKLPIRVTCDGIKTAVPAGKTATTATTTRAKCKVDLRIKIWKWTV